jgi:hypothetical protein
MIRTLIISLPALADIFVLIIIIMVIFSILSMTLFYNVNTEQDPYGFMDQDFVKYDNFGDSMVMLFRHTTGEAWNGIMYYTAQSDPYLACQKAYGNYLSDGCAGGGLGLPPGLMGRLVHVFWTILATYMLMQLFTAVILENFAEQQLQDKAVLPVDKLNEFVDAWSLLDPEAVSSIETKLLPDLIRCLAPPLGVKTESLSRVSVLRVIKDLDIPILKGNRISYQQTFQACVRRVINDDIIDDDVSNEDEDQLMPSGSDTPTSGNSRQNRNESAPALAKDAENGPAATSAAVSTASSTSRGSRLASAPDPSETLVHFYGRPFTAAEDFAARSVQLAYRDFRERKLQVFKGMRRTTQIRLNCDPSEIRL